MAEPLKDMVGDVVVRDLADRIVAEDPRFDDDTFCADLAAQLPRLELKPRIAAIARRIREGLGGDYRSALLTVVAVARAEPGIEGFAAWPLCTFVELFGVEDPASSLPAMEHLTKRASCEFAIRPFLIVHWDAAYGTLEDHAGHEHEAVRRLASEGMRPRLPWGKRVPRLIDDPYPGVALLERLRHDPSESVRRSVANHLNDVSKDHADVAVAVVRRWAAEDPAVDDRLASHALRTLVKRGHADALEALGYTADAAVEVEFDVTPQKVEMGDHLELSTIIRSTASGAQRLVVDFIIHHVTATGALAPKVFKWTTVDLAPRESVTLTKRRQIQMASTRTYYPGAHKVELQVAGRVLGACSFEVCV